MEVMMLQVLGLVLNVCAVVCSLLVQGSAVPPTGVGIPGHMYNFDVFITAAPTPVPQPNGLQPPIVMAPFTSAPVPQTPNDLPSSTSPSPLTSPPNLSVPLPTPTQNSAPSRPPIPSPEGPQHSDHPPFTAQAPASLTSPSSSSSSSKQTHPRMPELMPPKSHQTKAPVNSPPQSEIAPAPNLHAPMGKPESPPPSHSVLADQPPSLPPDGSTRPALPGNFPPVTPILNEPPASPPERNASPVLARPPSISKKTAATPVAAPANKTAHHSAPVSQSPTEAPTASNSLGHPDNAPPPHRFSKSTPEFHSPIKQHHAKVYMITPAPLSHVIPPTTGSSASASPIASPIPSSDNNYPPVPAPPPVPPSWQAKIPPLSPKKFPSGSSPRSPKMPLSPPLQALPPPPPHKDCAPLTCTEPLTYGPAESLCLCVLPIQVGLRLTVALYTFFPLVTELAAEIAAGVFMKQSQVRIMGANAAGDNPEKTIVLIDLLPLGEKFDDTTAYLTFQRFWHKQVLIKTSLFGVYDVLYVRYPGLPPSPPLPPSTIGIISSKPYPGHDNNARTMQPLGVDISQKQHNHGPSGSILATIILSCLVGVLLLSAVAWLLLFRYRHCGFQPDPTPTTMIGSLAKSSGIPVSMVGSGPSSPSFSLGSSIAAYTGSAKTFSSSDIERATDFFNETRILGEGGFGRVFSGVLEDGTKVAVKLLKRYDQQGGREFLAEVEMLSRLHHRNLVKLIGICVEDRTRCLVYELIPNGSVESHLHGKNFWLFGYCLPPPLPCKYMIFVYLSSGSDKERSPLDWSARLKIALGAARALAYLHEDSSPRVIHRDFKASNILLEDDFTPKVSDFGLARAALDEENRHISTRVMGTFGYVAPEYAMTGHLLVKSDVYSYGVVLLELLTGRKPVDMSQPPGQENLVSWARPLLTSREGLESIIDQSLGPDFPYDSIAKVAAIASMCVQPEVSQRPFMGEVVQALKLVCSESDETKELLSRSSSHENLSIVVEAKNNRDSDQLPAPLLSPSTVSDYDYQLDIERDLSMSELLSSSAKFGTQDSESFRRHSSSGPLRTARAKPLWKKMRRLSGGSVSEHGVLFKLWPGSH
ncbi:receptor-like serine/threonine-protein kinase ALE2 isoform X1 [Sesamum indicum]|uniref:Receptor-like serine/threonine-protein kinase ALE2 isoform X1 n=2 Tax=Sesamum indicum TaxID=4182 RepID=A0A8M8URP0_SESIN|nr:receptor-like serine/threonine-protein kinase ALE2 isoform X1 [Sesamum indicum]